MRAGSPAIWIEPSGRAAALKTRVTRAVRQRIERLRPLPPAAPAPDGSAQFAITGHDARFCELEAILRDARVMSALCRPLAPIAKLEQPPVAGPPAIDPVLPAVLRRNPVTVFDLVPFGIELDVLELRILEYADLVDHFIIVESPRSFGGLRKPNYFAAQRARFAAFDRQIIHVALDDHVLAPAWSGDRRGPTTFSGEDAIRAETWRAVRARVDFPPSSVVIYADVDEFPSRPFLNWIRSRESAMPLRLRAGTLRYSFNWLDVDTDAQIVMFGPRQFDAVDAAPHAIRAMHGPVLGATGAVHLTSFLPPLGLIAKFAMTTDWDPGIIPLIRNNCGETAQMMAAGRWFGRRLTAYDADHDGRQVVPWAARAYRDRFAPFWGAS